MRNIHTTRFYCGLVLVDFTYNPLSVDIDQKTLILIPKTLFITFYIRNALYPGSIVYGIMVGFIIPLDYAEMGVLCMSA